MFGAFQPKSVVKKVLVTHAPPKPPQQKGTAKPQASPANGPRPSTPKPSGPLSNRLVPSTPSSPRHKRTPEPGKTPARPKSTGKDAGSLVKRATKRKACTPPLQWDADASDSDAASDMSSLGSSARKRVRSSASSVDPGRVLAAAAAAAAPRDGEGFELAHGADLVSGENAGRFRPAFFEEVATAVEVQYPSEMGRERFFLADSVESDGYKSMEDISETVKYVVANYLPAREAGVYGDDGTGFERRLIRALNGGQLDEYVKVIGEYNDVIEKRVRNGSMAKVLGQKHGVEFGWMKRILDQVYSRTVSPHVELLKEYKNGTDNVYGELLYPLVSELFRETGLRSDQIFVDLGSGVGNVVLQAALEIGCESWGCEMMKNPCDLAELQAQEFPQRARLWGLSVGRVKLLRGDFLENKEIGEVLKKADVVLVNNQAFGPDLNSKLVDRFLDLKDGCQVVSLKSFKPEGFEIQERNVNDVRHLLQVRKLEYFSNRVSWTDAPGNYFIATKDPTDLIEFQRGMAKRKSRR